MREAQDEPSGVVGRKVGERLPGIPLAAVDGADVPADGEMEGRGTEAFEECFQKICELRSILNQRPDRAVLLIQVLDREWFEEWIRKHTPPASQEATERG